MLWHRRTQSAPATTRANGLRPKKRAPLRSGVGIALFTVLIAGNLVWSFSSPEMIDSMVDAARSLVGPEPVAQVEALAFQVEDAVQKVRYRTGRSAPAMHWSAPGTQLAPASSTAPASKHTPAAPVRQPAPATSIAPEASGLWTPYVSTASGQTVLERALIHPDASRPYAQAALVRIDLQQTALHLVAGTQEPASNAHIARSGRIPAADYARLVAAFNGGFKAVNGAFGMGVQNTVLLPPRAGLATIALYRDGSVRLGTWGGDIRATPDMVAFRQNCPLLVDNGVPSPLASTDDAALWGKTVGNQVATWRSGVGVSADGRYLVYVAGNGLTVPTLAAALVQAGASRAMQLDINSIWTRFVTYAPAVSGQPSAQKLLDAMAGDNRQFIAPDTRDFFYLTLR